MMRVLRCPEPRAPTFDFDALVRTPGDAHWAARPNPLPPKTSVSKYLDRKPLWRLALPSLRGAFGEVCAYSCVWIDDTQGAATVDHARPKHRRPDLAYDWDNFRYASRTMNTRKGTARNLCDAFTVRDDWFLLNFMTFALTPHPAIVAADPKCAARVQRTIDRLALDSEQMRTRRERAWKLYEDRPCAVTWAAMTRDCPLLDRQWRLQHHGQVPPAALLP